MTNLNNKSINGKSDIDIAKDALLGHSIALVKDGEVLTDDKRGVAPMLCFIAEGRNLRGYSVADKIVGKAAASLFVLAGIKEVYAEVASISAKDYLQEHSVRFSCGIIVDKIINRSGTGICPMEDAVSNISDPEKCHKAIVLRLEELKRKNNQN